MGSHREHFQWPQLQSREVMCVPGKLLPGLILTYSLHKIFQTLCDNDLCWFHIFSLSYFPLPPLSPFFCFETCPWSNCCQLTGMLEKLSVSGLKTEGTCSTLVSLHSRQMAHQSSNLVHRMRLAGPLARYLSSLSWCCEWLRVVSDTIQLPKYGGELTVWLCRTTVGFIWCWLFPHLRGFLEECWTIHTLPVLSFFF